MGSSYTFFKLLDLSKSNDKKKKPSLMLTFLQVSHYMANDKCL